jgi:RNA polymerase sigma factor (TIGR02999 family)
MNNVTQILKAIRRGETAAAGELLPLVYEELRKLAAARLAQEPSGHTLQATALVHEAYVRLVDVDEQQEWDGRGHFFAAAAEAMRRVLVDSARRKQAARHGGNLQRQPMDRYEPQTSGPDDKLLALDEALEELAKEDPVKSELVQLRYFGGLTNDDAAKILGISSATAERYWTFARAWLFRKMSD